METSTTYESYPIRTVILSNLVSLAIYFLGIVIVAQTWWILSVFYLVFIFALELRLIRNHCTCCYYWGKTCGFGKGRVSALFFKKGDISKFCNNSISWKDMIPDLLITVFPLIAGIISLILKFNIFILLALCLMIALTTVGNAYIRGSLTCTFCKQKELGCPAERLFNKGKESELS